MEINKKHQLEVLEPSLNKTSVRYKQSLSNKLKRYKLEIRPNLQTLPEEILQNITQHLSQQDTFTLLTLSKSFINPCLYRLYKKLRICEKYQDTFHYTVALSEKSSLISSFPIILGFLRIIYDRSQQSQYDNDHKADIDPAFRLTVLDGLKFVEELHSFNYLDSGELDIHRYLTKLDLKNQLRLRQYWDTFVNELKSLKVWNLPKLSIDKVAYLHTKVKAQIRSLSFSLSGLDNPDAEDSYYVAKMPSLNGFKSLKELCVNLDGANIEAIPITSIIHLRELAKSSCDTIETLEFNGNFGKLDRNIEHYLRHLDFSQDVNLKSSFMKGFEVGKLVYKHGFGVNEIKRSFNEIGNEGEEPSGEAEGVQGEEEDEDTDTELELDETQPEQFLSPIINNLKFASNCHFQQFTPQLCNSGNNLWGLIQKLMMPPFHFTRLRTLSLNNFIFDGSEMEHQYFLDFLHHSGISQLEELKLVNVYQSRKNARGRIRFADLFTCLKSLTLILFEHESQGIEINSSTGTITDISSQFTSLDSLLSVNSKLERLSVSGFGDFFTLKTFISFISRFQSSMTLQEVSLTLPQDTHNLMRRLVNIYSFKKLSKFGDLAEVDDLSFTSYKKLIEIFNRVLRVENYQDSSDSSEIWKDSGFENEMRFLYEDDIKPVWKVCPCLRRFVYFGVVFKRPLYM